MKKSRFTESQIIKILLATALFASCGQQSEPTGTVFNAEQKAIEATIINAYVEGLQNEGDTVKIDKGFHPQFALLGKKDDGSILVLPIAEWRERKKQSILNGDLPRDEPNRVSAKFEFIDVSDDVAVAKLFYYEGDKHTYTDYISLYKFGPEWKIVSKMFTEI
jgi:hypothetical protein